MLYKLDSDFCILVMESGESITITDALKYLTMDIKVAPLKPKNENADGNRSEDEDDVEAKPEPDDDPTLPKVSKSVLNFPFANSIPLQSLCQECLEKLQSAYEFKYRCEENRSFLRNYLRECADSKLAEERAAKEAALAALDIDIDNLDALPDKLVLKDLRREKKPRKPRDPARTVVRRRKIPEKNIIIAEDSQVDSAAYVRKIVTTPEQSPDQARSSKRKSKHVIIEDVMVGEKAKKDAKVAKEKKSNTKEDTKENDVEVVPEADPFADLPTKIEKKDQKAVKDADEPEFEDDEDSEEQPEAKRSKRLKK